MSAPTPEQVTAALQRLQAFFDFDEPVSDDLALIAQALAALEAERDALRKQIAEGRQRVLAAIKEWPTSSWESGWNDACAHLSRALLPAPEESQ